MAAKLVEHWLKLLPADPRGWIFESDEPSARWVARRQLYDQDGADPEVKGAKQALLDEPEIRELIARLSDWEKGITASGHNSPDYASNLLHLLADLGLGAEDDPRTRRAIERMTPAGLSF